MLSRLTMLEIREMLERHWTASDIAHKMHLDLALIQQAIQQLAG